MRLDQSNVCVGRRQVRPLGPPTQSKGEGADGGIGDPKKCFPGTKMTSPGLRWEKLQS